MRKDPKDINLHGILDDLRQSIWSELAFSCTIKANYNEYTKDWYYGITVAGTFSKKDINRIDAVARKHDVYYEFGSGGLLISACIGYSFNGNDGIDGDKK
jgi:hypothetical protein